IKQATEPDEKYVSAVEGIGIDGAIKGNRNPRLGIETVQLVQQRRIQAIRWMRGTVGEGHVDAEMRVLMVVQHRERVAGERRLRGGTHIEERMNIASQRQGWHQEHC